MTNNQLILNEINRALGTDFNRFVVLDSKAEHFDLIAVHRFRGAVVGFHPKTGRYFLFDKNGTVVELRKLSFWQRLFR